MCELFMNWILNTFKIPSILAEAQREKCIFVVLDTTTQVRQFYLLLKKRTLIQQHTINKQNTE